MLSATAVAVTGGFAALPACSPSADRMTYEEAQRQTWHSAGDAPANRSALMLELVRCATLAASSHNTQCWQFRVDERAISILPDLTRRCPAVDPDDHHLFVSLGCAAENLVQAARAYGMNGEVRFDASADGGVRVTLEPTAAVPSALFEAIPRRQCTRAEFDGQPISNTDLKLLEQAGTGSGVRVMLITERPAMESVLAHVVQANSAQMKDPAFVEELKSWIRFSDDEAVATSDGLFSRTSGNPSVPRWLGSPLFRVFFREARENDKYAKHIRSSSGIAVFAPDSSSSSGKAHWVETGRCYERFALQATALGIRHAHLNQPVEVSALRPQFAASLGLNGQRPDLVVRFGRGSESPRSLRRPVQAVLV